MATKAADLYDEDFYAWTQQQAEVLRTHFQGDNRLDVEHLAEEVEDLGKSELHAIESYVENIIDAPVEARLLGWLEWRGITGERDRSRSERASTQDDAKYAPNRSRELLERLRSARRRAAADRCMRANPTDPTAARRLSLRLAGDRAP